MKKAKDILNPNTLSKLVVAVAAILVVVAVIVVIISHVSGHPVIKARTAECRDVVAVASGDTLSKLLIDQGLTPHRSAWCWA